MKRLGSLADLRDIETTRNFGQVFNGRLFRFIYHFVPAQAPTVRACIIIGRRHGSAVRRNLLRRRTREACRLLLGANAETLGLTSRSLSLIIMLKRGNLRAGTRVTFTQVRSDVESLVDAIAIQQAGRK